MRCELLVVEGVAERGLVVAGCLVALLASGCSEKERCEADKSLAEVCADGHCPKDLKDAVAKGRACDINFYQVWRDGENSAVGIDGGYAGSIYYFQGRELVGYETYTDVLDANDPCPSQYVTGMRSLLTNRYVSGSVSACSSCPDYASDDLPLCTDAELE